MTALIEEPATDAADIGRFPRLLAAYDPDGLTPDQIARAAEKASIETRMELARYYIATGRPVVAATLLKALATGWSNDIQARYARAGGAMGHAGVAARAAQAILARDPDNGDALLIQADAKMARGDPAAAIVDYQRVVRDYPQWEEGYFGLARAYTATDKPIAVRRVFEDGRRALPQSLPFARAYTAALIAMNNGERAVEVARRFAFDSPSLIAGWTLYRDTCAKAGGSECRGEAAEGLRTARTRFGLDLVPGTPPPIALIGRLT
jgi:predicted Zn-dependent protease